MTNHTRLSYTRSKKPEAITEWIRLIKHRVQIYAVQYDGSKWYVWYVPPDDRKEDSDNIDLDEI